MKKRIKWSKERIIKEIKKLKYKNAKYAKNSFATLYGAVLRYFKSWEEALLVAGFSDYNSIVKCRIWTDKEILDELKKIKNKRSKYNQKYNSRLYSNVIRHFGSWKNGIKLAGFDYNSIIFPNKKWIKKEVIEEIKKIRR